MAQGIESGECWNISQTNKADDSSPLISIVTPSYNQGNFLEETILSVIKQDYPSFEYIIIDGGSSDNSIEIIKKYEKYLSYWISEPDKGQADAIVKGFRHAKGEILGYLNSDDYLLPNCLQVVGTTFTKDINLEFVIGKSIVVDHQSKLMYQWNPPFINYWTMLFSGCWFHQPSSFWRKRAYDEVGGINPNLRFALDYDLFIKLAKRKRPKVIKDILAAFRVHQQSKTSTLQTICEQESMMIQKGNGIDDIPLPITKTIQKLFPYYVKICTTDQCLTVTQNFSLRSISQKSSSGFCSC